MSTIKRDAGLLAACERPPGLALRAESPRCRIVLPPTFFCAFLCLVVAMFSGRLVAQKSTVIVVAGAPGEGEFAADFAAQLAAWAKVSAQAEATYIAIGEGEAAGAPDRERFRLALEAEVKNGTGELWLIFVGHGTFDGKEAKLNLRGPDLSATDLGEWLKPFRRPLAIIDTTSSSAPFLAKLAAPGRVIVSATRSGHIEFLQPGGSTSSRAAATAVELQFAL